MTKARRQQRKKKSPPNKGEGGVHSIDEQLGRLPPLPPELEEEEWRLRELENAKLLAMFGSKNDYTGEEVEAAIKALKAEGSILPDPNE